MLEALRCALRKAGTRSSPARSYSRKYVEVEHLILVYGKVVADRLSQICVRVHGWNYRGRLLHRYSHRNENSSFALLGRSGVAFQQIATLAYLSVVNAHCKRSIGTYILDF